MKSRVRTERQWQAQLRKAHDLPYRCECGGVIAYDYEFERVWSYCKRCTPVVRAQVPQ